MKILSFTTLFIILFSSIHAQNKSQLVPMNEKLNLIQCAEYQWTEKQYFEQNTEALGLTRQCQYQEVSKVQEGAFLHKKFQQIIQGFNVYDGYLCLHLKDNIVDHITGRIQSDLEFSTEEQMSLTSATEHVKRLHLGIKSIGKKMTQSEMAALADPNIEIIESELIAIDRNYPRHSNNLSLAWRLIVQSKNKLDKKEYIIDARTGRKLLSHSIIRHIDVPSKAKTKYYGDKMIISDSLSPNNFLLKDNSRAISTFTEKNGMREPVRHSDSYWNFNSPQHDEVAMDAHYCATVYHDYLLNKFNHKGLDGKGEAFNSVVQIEGGRDFFNAFWDGDVASFGNGDCNHNPLTTLSIIAHEFTHGLIQRTAGLEGSSEGDALHETISDIFGKACEYYADRARFNWELDPLIGSTKYSQIIRSFSDPHSLKHPKAYRGKYWDSEGDPHSQGEILNHWFYILIEGKSGTNEFGTNYSVKAVAMDDVMKVLYSCLVNYLNNASGFEELRLVSLQASKNLFGENSDQYKSIEEAWLAIAVNSTVVPDIVDLSISFDQSQNKSFCQNQTKSEIKVLIENSGTKTITQGKALIVDFSFDLIAEESRRVVLIQDLKPGEMIEQTFLVDISNVDPDLYSADVSLFYVEDEEEENNDDFDILRILKSTPNDIEIFAYLNNSTLECTKFNKRVIIGLINNSCDEIAAGTPYSIKYSSIGSKDIIQNKILASDLLPGEYYFFIDTVGLSKEYDQIDVTLQWPGDLNDSNNTDFIENEVKLINSPMTFDFSDEDYLRYFYEENLFGFGNTPYEYNNNFYHINSGLPLEFSEGNLPPCEDKSRNFANTNGFVELLSTCVDLANEKSIQLSFDVIQFRNDSYKFQELRENTSMLNVIWEENNQLKNKLIAGQVEGKLYHYDIKLPDNYVGKLEFQFFNLSSGAELFSSHIPLSHDVILLDNLSISTSVSVENPNKEMEIDIYPNPILDQLFIYNGEKHKTKYNITNIDGKQITGSDIYQNRTQLEISFLDPGMYLLNLKKDNGWSKAIKFIKI